MGKAKNDTVFYGNVNSQIFPIGDNIIISSYVLSTPIRPELILYNPKTNTIVDSLPNYYTTKLRKGGSMISFGDIETAFSEYKNELYSMCIFSDTLYKITEKEILPFAIFDFGENKYTTNIPFMPFAEMRLAWWKAIRLKGIMRTSNTLYVQFEKGAQKRGMINFIYALNLNDFTGQYYKGHFINDLDNGPNYSLLSAVSSNPNQIFDVATLKAMPDDKFQKAKDRLFPDNKMPKKMKNLDEFKRLWDKSTEDSNPIIQFLKLK